MRKKRATIETDHFDVVVVGGGTAGMTAALSARQAGASVALVEGAPQLGGDCTFTGCVPSKALIEVAQLVHGLRRAAAEGIFGEIPALDFARVAARRSRIVDEIAYDERDERFVERGIAVLHGTARFTGSHDLRVGEHVLIGERFVIATGSEPGLPPVRGLAELPYLTNETVFELERLPQRLLVLGGGSVGLELAQAFRRFGSDVAVIEQLERLLPREEPEAGELVARALAEDGIELRLGATVGAARREGDRLLLALADGEVAGDALLVATGRRASIAGLGLERLGVELEGGYVKVDGRCRTSARHVFAAGDVTGGLQFTHVAAQEGRVAGLNAAGKRSRLDERVAPSITFTDPEVARVGLTEAEARGQLRGVEAVTFPLDRVDRARIAERPQGFVKLVTARRPLLGRLGGGELVGAQIVGAHAGELIHECALAMQTRAFAGRLAQTIHAYPSWSMAVQQAAAQLFPLGRALAGGRQSEGGKAAERARGDERGSAG
jgi:pyruvate/2-oxoglutarate dehydrogenase complex dihydrolipoamide dehydrogenase (E3) component